MSREVVPQIDVGVAGLAGLTAFGPMLAALSADEVAPGSMVQLAQLGAMFHINGPHVSQLPELMQRCSSTRLDRLGLLIGWRKGDAASYMSQTAGGLAGAVLSLCLRNMYDEDTSGAILYDLSGIVLPNANQISGIGQLGQLATLLCDKIAPLGFGNMLAKQTLRIRETYDNLNLPCPCTLFDTITRETMAELLAAISSALMHEDKIVRIVGSHSMAYIAGMTTFMFPEDVTLLVESYVIQSGTRRSVVIDIVTTEEPTSVQTERVLLLSEVGTVPIKIQVEPVSDFDRTFFHVYHWRGHIAAHLHITFASFGAQCSKDLLAACAEQVVTVSTIINGVCPRSEKVLRTETALSSNGFTGLLGNEPIERLYRTCNDLLGTPPIKNYITLEMAHSRLIMAFKASLQEKSICSCPSKIACFEISGWERMEKARPNFHLKRCIARILWAYVGSALNHLLLFSLLNPMANATVRLLPYDWTYPDIFTRLLKKRAYLGPRWFSCQEIYKAILDLLEQKADGISNNVLARSNGSSTIYPQVLLNLQHRPEDGYHFNLADGRLIVKGRYYKVMRSVPTRRRTGSSESLPPSQSECWPSSAGEHQDLFFTAQETANEVLLRTVAVVRGQNIQLDLAEIIVCSMGLECAGVCDHALDTRLDAQYTKDILTTSIAAPESIMEKISVVQTRDNRTAQLLACVPGRRLFLKQKCCLECALKRAQTEDAPVQPIIIVGR